MMRNSKGSTMKRRRSLSDFCPMPFERVEKLDGTLNRSIPRIDINGAHPTAV